MKLLKRCLDVVVNENLIMRMILTFQVIALVIVVYYGAFMVKLSFEYDITVTVGIIVSLVTAILMILMTMKFVVGFIELNERLNSHD